VFENRVLRRIFGLKRDEVTGAQDVCGWIILRWILERWDGVVWTGLVWLRIGTGGELL
jgi:hypothetical protein